VRLLPLAEPEQLMLLRVVPTAAPFYDRAMEGRPRMRSPSRSSMTTRWCAKGRLALSRAAHPCDQRGRRWEVRAGRTATLAW
jgi:hypothetical protein